MNSINIVGILSSCKEARRHIGLRRSGQKKETEGSIVENRGL